MTETGAKELKDNELVTPINEKWDLSPHLFENTKNNFHIYRNDSASISNFIYRRKEGALLISGKRGVGKTSIIASTINSLRERLESNNEPKKTTLLPVLINAANFEIWETSRENFENNTNHHADPTLQIKELDYIKLKRILMENLVRRLFQLTYNYKVKKNGELWEIILNEKIDIANSLFPNEKDLAETLAVEAGIASLYRRAVAKEATSTMKTEETEATEKIKERRYTIKFGANERLLLIISSLIAGIILGFNPLLEKTLNTIISILLVILPTLGLSLLGEFQKRFLTRNNDAQIASTFYRYDYDLSNLEVELESTLRQLQKKDCKVIFVIDELDKIHAPEIVSGVIKFLKTLFNQGHAIFILVTGKELFLEIMKNPQERLTEYTLFTQTVFLQRAQFEEVRTFIDKTIDIDPAEINNDQNAVRILFNFDDLQEGMTIKDYVKNNDHINDNLMYIENATVTKNNDNIDITYNKKIAKGDGYEQYSVTLSKGIDTSKTLTFPDETGKIIMCDFGVLKIKKNAPEEEYNYFLFSKSRNFSNFQYYSCYKSRTDFFDLYKVLGDNMEYTPLKLNVMIDDNLKTYANLQRALEFIFIRKKSKNPSLWFQNDLILDNMYTFLNDLTERHMHLRYIEVVREPFEIRYFSKLEDIGSSVNNITKFIELREIGYSEEIIQDALYDLIRYLFRLKFLTLTSKRNVFEVTGSLPDLISIKTPTKEEEEFVDQYSLLCYVIWSYVRADDEYGRK